MLEINAKAVRYAAMEWVTRGQWTQFWTLSFNQTASLRISSDRLSEFFQRYDRKCLGRNYARMPERRLVSMAFAEHLSTNIHFHCFVELYPEQPGRELEKRVEQCWKSVVSSGTVHLESIYDLKGAADYVTKEWRRPDDVDRIYFSEEFWPEAKGLTQALHIAARCLA